MSNLLATIRCKSCGAPLSVPVTLPKVKVQCGACGKLNVRQRGRWSVQDVPTPVVKPLPTPKTPEPVVVAPVEAVFHPEEVEPVEAVFHPEEVEPVETLTWSPDMLKADLVAIATKLGIDTSGMLKREVVDALENLR